MQLNTVSNTKQYAKHNFNKPVHSNLGSNNQSSLSTRNGLNMQTLTNIEILLQQLYLDINIYWGTSRCLPQP